MNQTPGNGQKNSPLKQLENIEKLARSFIDYVKSVPGDNQSERMLHLSMQFACINFSALKEQLENAEAGQYNTQSESAPDSRLAELLNELSRKDQKIQDFKISLADSVMENKALQKKMTEYRESSERLTAQVSQMQLHTKDITLKLDSANSNLKLRQAEIDSLEKRLAELKAELRENTQENAQLEQQLEQLRLGISRANESEHDSIQEKNKSEQDLKHITASFESLKLSHEALEFRENELEATIESLQREKNHLQAKLDKFLMGSKRTAFYHSHTKTEKGSSILEPSIIPEFLPFCFPERLPVNIKFRREIEKSWRSSANNPTNRQPIIFASYRMQKPGRHAIRSISYDLNLLLPPREKHAIGVSAEKCSGDFTLNEKSCSSKVKRSILFAAGLHQEKKPEFLIKKTHRKLAVICSPAPVYGQIIDNSFELFLRHMENNSCNLLLKRSVRLNFIFKPFVIKDLLENHMKTGNIFSEKLAFRYRFQLQSQKIKTPEPVFVCSFKKGNKLKSVLELFGKSISLMVEKYDIIATSPGRNGGGAK